MAGNNGLRRANDSASGQYRPREVAVDHLVDKFGSDEILGLVALVGAFACGLILGPLGIALGFYHQAHLTRRTETLAALKQDMLSRGMSTDEIQAVLEAGTTPQERAGRRCRV
jgi:hypothetical protein